jgi:RsiW-degrading membrane proteinase PrsW (M82 family)
MSFLVLNFFLAAVPSVLLLIYFYRRDKQKKEPITLIWRIFALGCLAVLPAALIELALEAFSARLSGFLLIFVRAFVVAALVEESLKLGVVRFFVFKRKEFDEVTDGIVYTITASLGFALLENLLYSFGPPGVLIIRGISAVPLHAIASGIMGYYIGLSRFSEHSYIGLGLFFAVMIHGLYDFCLFYGMLTSWVVIPLLIICWRILRRLTDDALRIDRETGHSSASGEEEE